MSIVYLGIAPLNCVTWSRPVRLKSMVSPRNALRFFGSVFVKTMIHYTFPAWPDRFAMRVRAVALTWRLNCWIRAGQDLNRLCFIKYGCPDALPAGVLAGLVFVRSCLLRFPWAPEYASNVRHPQADIAQSDSHVTVIYWFDRNDTPEKRVVLQVHPQGNKANPMRGVFATHSPVRPNLIAISRCKILTVRDNVIEIDSIDAFPDTPVLDLKN